MKPEEVKYICLDLCTSKIDQAAATLEEIEFDITRRVEMARAEGYHDEHYNHYVILTLAELRQLKFYNDKYNHVKKQWEVNKWSFESVLSWVCNDSHNRSLHYTPKFETLPMKRVKVGKYHTEDVPTIGTQPKPRWTKELEIEYAAALNSTLEYYARNPAAAFDSDLDPLELLPF